MFWEIDVQLHKFWVFIEWSEEYSKKSSGNMFINFFKAFNSLHILKIEQILLAYGLKEETVIAMMMLLWKRYVSSVSNFKMPWLRSTNISRRYLADTITDADYADHLLQAFQICGLHKRYNFFHFTAKIAVFFIYEFQYLTK